MNLTQGESPPVLSPDGLVPLESILFTEELKHRPSRPPDYERENRALTALVLALANSPGTILQTLADTILEVFQAGSAGLSLLTKDEQRFYWPAIAGGWEPHVGGGTPRNFSPCGDVLDCDSPLLFKRWDLRYPYLQTATPLAEEGLLVPFYVGGKAVGTIWAIAHHDDRTFDGEDLRLLESLSRFASAAYQAVKLQKVRETELAAVKAMEDAVHFHHHTETLNVKLRKEITEREKTEEQLRLSKQRLAEELEATRCLYEVSTQLIQADNIEKLYDTILDTAVAIMHSDLASLQMFHPERGTGGELHLLRSRGFKPQMVKFWEWVGVDCTSTCGVALSTKQRCMVADVQKCDFIVGHNLEAHLQTGVQAVQSTPLLSRAGALIGMISTHWRTPHEATASELRLLDILARQVADLIERNQAATALRQSEARFRALFDLGPVGIYSLDATGMVQEFNAVAVQLWGREPKRGEDRYCASHELFFNGEPMSHEQTPMVGVLSGEIPEVRDAEVVIGRPDGSRVTVIANIVPLKNDRGEITGVMNCFYDITERKRAEEKLRESEERYRVLYGALPVAAFVCDRNAVIQNYNRRAVELWGREPKVEVERHCGSMKLILPDGSVLPHAQSPMMEVLRTGTACRNVEVFIERPDGSRIPVIVNFCALKDAQGEIVGAVTSFDDITERKQAQDALRESEEFNRSIIESSPDCIKTLDLKGTLISMQNGQELLGIPDIRPFLNKSWIELWDSADQPMVRAAVEGAAAGQSKNFVAFFRTFDGQPKWWDVAITPMLDAQGRPVRLLAVSRDVTRRQQQEEALRESEARFRTLFNGVPIAIYSTDAAGIIQEFNPVAVELWGREPKRGDPDEKYCASYRLHLPDGSHMPHDQTPVVAVLSGQVPAVRDAEVVIERPDGSRVTVIVNIVPLKNAAGEITGVMNCFYDITARKRGEVALGEAQTQLTDRAGHLECLVAERTAELTASNEQLEAFVYSVAHDLRAPLRSMQGFSAMLVEEAGATLSKTGRDFAGRINSSAQFMDALLIDLLAFSRAAQEQITLAPVNLETLVHSVLSRLEKEVQEKKGCLKGSGPWPAVLGHEPALGQVIFNLVSNALKFSRPDAPPCIRVHAEEQSRFIRVWVEDNGIGIASDHQAQIFGLFTRLHGSNFPGTGIGLAIVRKSVERMGGNIGVESTPGEGSRFWFDMPKAGLN